MGPEHYMIYSNRSDGVIYVVADFLTVGWNWPSTIRDDITGETFGFFCNEPMEDWMIGNCGGHAKYIKIQQSLPV